MSSTNQQRTLPVVTERHGCRTVISLAYAILLQLLLSFVEIHHPLLMSLSCFENWLLSTPYFSFIMSGHWPGNSSTHKSPSSKLYLIRPMYELDVCPTRQYKGRTSASLWCVSETLDWQPISLKAWQKGIPLKYFCWQLCKCWWLNHFIALIIYQNCSFFLCHSWACCLNN